ncbi:NYN domain-containing protein [Arcanobacterium canis]|uniref:NYN domain-containing protein n=1 Tax=Arcanobacterium canis TaxID=999183 RepID=A0ABY8FY66_9ACTO|nr:NYN domain-containing protein [Arcanobacterium canis]WFM83454.1 NYN domain-containing protein [Arcanobacterium canis]
MTRALVIYNHFMHSPQAKFHKQHHKHRNILEKQDFPLYPVVTAILVDGGFYRRQAFHLFGDKTPQQRADELVSYCYRHIKNSSAFLYRIFYYDCPPSEKVLYHPLLKKQINLGKSSQYQWTKDFFNELIHRRKVALRRGEELETQHGYTLAHEPLKKLLSGKIQISDLTESDFKLDITQKGVDMRLGLDIASLATGGQVNQIVMISGDSDFVPAAKLARKSGIDFVLDPMWANISHSLSEHVDGVVSVVKNHPDCKQDPLHIDNLKDQTAPL